MEVWAFVDVAILTDEFDFFVGVDSHGEFLDVVLSLALLEFYGGLVSTRLQVFELNRDVSSSVVSPHIIEVRPSISIGVLFVNFKDSQTILGIAVWWVEFTT